MYMCKKK